MRVPAALLAFPLLAGIVAGLVLPVQPAQVSLAFAGAAAVALAAAWAAVALGLDAECLTALAVGCAAAGVSLGSSDARRVYDTPLAAWFDALAAPRRAEPTLIVGVLREDAGEAGGRTVLLVDVEQVGSLGARQSHGLRRVSGGVRLSVGGAGAAAALPRWRAGRRIRAPAVLRPPTYYLDPGVPDDRRALARRGVVLVGTVKSASLVDDVAEGSLVAEGAASARAWARSGLEVTVGRWSARSAAVAKAVLIGDRTGLSDEDTRRLQDAGTYHVIAISGGNIAVLTALLLGLARVARLPHRMAPLAAWAMLAVYGCVVVPGPSVSRALSAALIYLTIHALDQRAGALNLLAAVAALGAALSPVKVLDAGFLLSFGATAGILLVVPRLGGPGRHASRLRRALHIVAMLLWTTIAAEAALLPVGAVLFGRVTFWGLILNFVAIPLMSILQASAMAALALIRAPPLGAAAGWLAHVAAEGILASAAWTTVSKAMVWTVTQPAWWLVAAYYGAAAVALCPVRPRLRRSGGVLALCAAVVLVASPGWAGGGTLPAAQGLRVAFLDVGQADATAVVLPDGRALLVDAGLGPAPAEGDDRDGDAGFDAGLRVVGPALRSLGVRRLEALVLTHGDPDHIGGAATILREFRPRSVWEGIPVPPHTGLRALRRVADSVGASWRTVQAGDQEQFGEVTVRVLHPARPDWERQRVRNEDSIVLDVRLGDVAIVLPGDIGREGEAHVVSSLGDRAPVVLLKAPHHGSASSSSPALLDALRPSGVIYSAGRPSRYGHPAPVVVLRYRARGIPAFSTAEDGAVLLETDGAQVTLEGWATRRRLRIPGGS